eukprot:scaffold11144_cov111-Isochrysis_galbana.AAC.12
MNQSPPLLLMPVGHGVHALAGLFHFPIAIAGRRLIEKLVSLRLPDWSVGSSRSRVRLCDVHFQYPPKQLCPIHIVYRIGCVASLVVLQKCKPLVFLCSERRWRRLSSTAAGHRRALESSVLSTHRKHWAWCVGPRTCAGIEWQVDIHQLAKRRKCCAQDALRHTLLEAACEAETDQLEMSSKAERAWRSHQRIMCAGRWARSP